MFWLADWNWSLDKSILKSFYLICASVDDVVRLGVELWKGCNIKAGVRDGRSKVLYTFLLNLCPPATSPDAVSK